MHPNTPPPSNEGTLPLRLVVNARNSGPRRFIWEIVRGELSPTVVKQSAETFKTMEGAHAHGFVVLERLRNAIK